MAPVPVADQASVPSQGDVAAPTSPPVGASYYTPRVSGPSPVVPIAEVSPPATPAVEEPDVYASPVIPLAGLTSILRPEVVHGGVPPVPRPASPSTGSFLGLPPVEMSTRPAPVVADASPPAVKTDEAPVEAKKTDKDDAPDNAEADGKDDAEKPGRRRKLSEPVLWLIEVSIWVVAALIVSTVIRIFVVQLFVVPSGSMEDTLEKNDRIASLKYAHYQRGDIVVFVDPGEWLTETPPPVSPIHHFLEKIGVLASTDQQYLVKRVIGLPGDTVQCCTTSGALSVNGAPINETSYLKQPDMPASAFTFSVTVPAGRVFVMGDNRNNSADSRFHLCKEDPAGYGMNGFVPEDKIIGPVRAVVLPFNRMGHKPTPTSLFANVPPPTGSPPKVAAVSVTGGPWGSCHS